MPFLSVSPSLAHAQLKIVGHAADPNDCEEWGDDFLFEGEQDGRVSAGALELSLGASLDEDSDELLGATRSGESSMKLAEVGESSGDRRSSSTIPGLGSSGVFKLQKHRAAPAASLQLPAKGNALSRRISIRKSHLRSSLALPAPTEEQAMLLSDLMEFSIFLPGGVTRPSPRPSFFLATNKWWSGC